LEGHISEIVITPSLGGVFEVVVDDELVASKKSTGKHPAVEDVVAALRARL
jgi:selT/selW/selH-like putative selenoprotein